MQYKSKVILDYFLRTLELFQHAPRTILYTDKALRFLPEDYIHAYYSPVPHVAIGQSFVRVRKVHGTSCRTKWCSVTSMATQIALNKMHAVGLAEGVQTVSPYWTSVYKWAPKVEEA